MPSQIALAWLKAACQCIHGHCMHMQMHQAGRMAGLAVQGALLKLGKRDGVDLIALKMVLKCPALMSFKGAQPHHCCTANANRVCNQELGGELLDGCKHVHQACASIYTLQVRANALALLSSAFGN